MWLLKRHEILGEDHASSLLREALDANLEEMLIFLDLLADNTISHLVDVPVGPNETAMEEPSLLRCRPDSQVSWQVF